MARKKNSSVLYVTDYYATTQAVSDAIERSKSHNEIVLLQPWNKAVYDELLAESEGYAEGNEVHEFWGVDLNGDDWRVHLAKEPRENPNPQVPVRESDLVKALKF